MILVGFMGAGKTTVGRLLAERLGWEFVDLDDRIRERERRTVPDIFRDSGEEYFRIVESQCLRDVLASIPRNGLVLALGGGAFVEERNRRLLEDHGISLWLDCPFEVVKRRVAQSSHRPLAQDPEKFAALYEARREVYRLADLRVTIDCDDPDVMVERIVNEPVFR